MAAGAVGRIDCLVVKSGRLPGIRCVAQAALTLEMAGRGVFGVAVGAAGGRSRIDSGGMAAAAVDRRMFPG